VLLFYILGMLPCDTAAGYDHIAGAIGGALAGMYGADMLCYLTPAEHLGLPSVEHVKEGLIAFKIAAHIADVARGNRKAIQRNLEMSHARYRLDWKNNLNLRYSLVMLKEYSEKGHQKQSVFYVWAVLSYESC